jgi:hypothetical protein
VAGIAGQSRNCHRTALHEKSKLAKARLLTVEVRVLFRSLRHKFDPLDREILDRALDATCAAVKDNNNDPSPDFDSDAGLEAILRRELIEIAWFNGVSDPETLRDLWLRRLGDGTSA